MNYKAFSYRRLFLGLVRAQGLLPAVSITANVLLSKLRAALPPYEGALRIVALLGCAAAAVAAALALPAHVRAVHGGTSVLTAAALAIVCFVASIMLGIYTLLPSALRAQALLRTVTATLGAVLIAALAALSYNAWARAYDANPVGATVLVVVLVAVAALFVEPLLVFARFVLVARTATNIGEVPTLTSEVRRRAAFHEAGHALCFGMGTRIPEDATAMLDPHVYGMFAGMVSMTMPRDPMLITRELLEWHMLAKLAGRAAEEVMVGQASAGAAGDMCGFQTVATMYLDAGFGGGWCAEPKDDADRRLNQAALDGLASEYLEQAKRLVSANRERVEALSRQLLVHQYLDCEDIRALLKGFVVPDGFERLVWPPAIPVLPTSDARPS